jgi:hypothetical protein
MYCFEINATARAFSKKMYEKRAISRGMDWIPVEVLVVYVTK